MSQNKPVFTPPPRLRLKLGLFKNNYDMFMNLVKFQSMLETSEVPASLRLLVLMDVLLSGIQRYEFLSLLFKLKHVE